MDVKKALEERKNMKAFVVEKIEDKKFYNKC